MSIAKNQRDNKRQMGQFLTPPMLANSIVKNIKFKTHQKILEPSMGDGSFIIPLIKKFMALYTGDTHTKLALVLKNNIYGIEIDPILYFNCLQNIKKEWGGLPNKHNFICDDFLLYDFCNDKGLPIQFDYIIGNPPFGGTINLKYQDIIDKQFGVRNGIKIKKETYSFFIVKSMEILNKKGKLNFICSDTFLTIKTMKGLRVFLMNQAEVQVDKISFFSKEITQNTVLLKCNKSKPASSRNIVINKKIISKDNIIATPNYSWCINKEIVKYFQGPKIGDFMTATSGMTVGCNEFFIRKIIEGKIIETKNFSFYQKPITLKEELEKARGGQLSKTTQQKIIGQEKRGETIRDLKITQRKKAKKLQIPHPDYCYYNKASKKIIYTSPTHVVFWRNQGEAVYTYKKNGNWYLRGIGGKKYFFQEGITWNLIASRLRLRYLPVNYVLDSGAPCAFLKPNIDKKELFFILAWGLSNLCTHILKK